MKILRKHLLLCILIALLSGNVADKSPFHDDILTQNGAVSSNDDSINYRLPTNVKPISYDILLIPELKNDNFMFTGIEKIEVIVKEETNTITLHVGNIEIEIVTVVVLPDKTPIDEILLSRDPVTEKYNITAPKVLSKDTKLLISFTYKGILSDNMIGFYRSSYIEDGEIKWLAATQFQTTHARHAFPCFDEPSFKAKFTIRIARDANYKTLSNMKLKSSKQLKPGAKIWDVYEESIEMSTYLVAFVVSEFKSLEKPYSDWKFKVWSKPSTINQASYALQTGVKALEIFENKFGSQYKFPKMDMVAVPDFAAGAMENWGLVTYRESRMLYDQEESSAAAQQSVASVIAHELSHMWFGNLVTPEWWSYLWLSEGFARYFQYFGTEEIEQSWNMDEQFVVEQHQTALIVDGLETSLSMSREVSNKAQIAGIGDTITYNKGASVIRMMSHLLGDTIFEDALKRYLKNNQKEGLGNPDKLWNAVKEAIVDSEDPVLEKIDIKKIMESWTKKPGYPVVSVAVNDDGTVNITQERFLLRKLGETPTDITWWVPITFAQKGDFDKTSPKYLLSTNKSIMDFNINPKQWIIFNVQSSGFYRVNYDYPGWDKILNVLKKDDLNEIHVLNRASIVDDLLNLGRAGYLKYDMILDGLLYLKRETNYLPFKAAFNGLEYLNRRVSGHAEHALFKAYVLSLLSDINSQLGYEEDPNDKDQLNILLRREINNWLCNFDDEECKKLFRKKFDQWKEDKEKNRINPNERPIAYCTAIKHGTSEDWDHLWKEYSESNYAADQAMILNALGCSKNTNILQTYLKRAINKNYKESRIRKQDSTSVFAAVYNSGLFGAENVLEFVDNNHKEMAEYYGGQATIATILDGASQHLSTSESVNKFQQLIEKHKSDFKSIQESLDYSLKIIQDELKWYDKFSTSIIQWLEKYEERKYRLPLDIIPESYTISLTPYLEDDFHVDGMVTIDASVKNLTKQIILHSSNIEHKDDKVKVFKKLGSNQEEVTVLKTEVQKRFDYFVIYLEKELSVGTRLIIVIEYTASLNTPDLRGFYKSSYVDENGVTKWLAASHLEPVGARKMFPCFDEPELKAEFTIQVNVPSDLKNYHAISNMDMTNEPKRDENYVTYIFEKSKRMSTYLVAVIVSDFESKPKEKNKYVVYARPNAIDQAEYALSVIPSLVDFFEKTYNQKYQISKLYMAALPDFSSGAMENWGLLTYRETSMLYDKDDSSTINKQEIRNVIAHEISHQWFGNLVSPKWWEYLWLNEGFARYFEYHAPARINDDKALESQFVVDQVHSAFSADSSKSTHPMTHAVTTPREIQSIFDTINYAKAGSILRMVEKTFGTKVFDTALSDYLDKRKYDYAIPEHLYESLQQKVNEAGIKDKDIKTILNTWTTQSGYPVVNVTFTKDTIILEQKRFFLKDHKNNPDETTWHIPITYASIQSSSDFIDTTPKLWLTEKQEEIKPSNSVLIFNNQQSGYYRVNYNKDHWMQLIDYLKTKDFKTIHEINRAGLIDDVMNLARAGYIDYNIAISATMYLENEDSYFPWRAFFNNLHYLNNRFAGNSYIEGIYNKWLTTLIEKRYTQLGFEDGGVDEDDLTKIFRTHIRNWACKLGIGDCKFDAAKYFQRALHNDYVPPNYRDVAYCTAMRMDKADYNNYKFLWNKYQESTFTTEKLVILKSLACSENKDVLKKLLQEAVKENSIIRYQDSAKVFSNVYDASLIGVKAVIEVIKSDYDQILRRHSGDFTKIENIVSALASRLSTHDIYDEYKNLLNWLITKEPAFKNSVESYLATADYEFNWYDTNAPVIFAALENLFPNNNYRLPKSLDPNLYNVYLTPYMIKSVFEGKVEIRMTVKEDTSLIALNSHELNISNIKVFRSGKQIELLNIVPNKITQQLKIYLNNFVYENDVIVAKIKFNGILNNNMNGFYRSSYLDEYGMQHWLATTQFEPTHARKAFPCFDEPEFKSQFQINIQRPIHYNSLSNSPIERKIKGSKDNYMLDIFRTTDVKMSTYLVAFVVSEFKPAVDLSNELNVWGRPNVAKYGKYAQNISMAILNELMKFTGINYPLLKLDLVGIPDFSNGAMENWGLATFRENALFYNEGEITATHEKYLINTIAHELTHMWFGNLVTCEWWDYIWLNEGFAQYFESFISDQILQDYQFMDQFVVYELQSALSKDSSISAHPMTNRVQTPEEIAGIFDYVTYGKSASVLRMLFNAFDEKVHKLALRNYLQKLSYDTARPENLWESFDIFASIPINKKTDASFEEIMKTWTDQPGYPVVNATLNNGILTLTQERFFMNRNISGKEFYWIPIDIFIPADLIYADMSLDHKMWLGPELQSIFEGLIVKKHLWLGPEPQEIFINPLNDWYVVNYKQTGFYRVNYDTSSWNALINKLTHKGFEVINVLNRAQIIDDLFNLARANYVDYDLLLRATTYLEQETHHLPWKAFFNGLSYMYEILEEQSYQNDLNGYVMQLLSKMYSKVGFDDRDDETHLDKLNREMILQWACKLKRPECTKTSEDLYAAWRKNSSARIPPNARPAVYCTALKNGNEDDWDFLWDQYKKSNFATEKKVILTALGCPRNETILQNYLGKAIKKYNPDIRRQDVSAVFTSVCSQSSIGVNATLDFLITNAEALHQYFGNWNDVADLFVSVASHISNKGQYKNLRSFIERSITQYPPIVRQKLLSSITTAETNLLWQENYSPKIGQWIVNAMKKGTDAQDGSSTRIESLNIVSTILIALVSYLLKYL